MEVLLLSLIMASVIVDPPLAMPNPTLDSFPTSKTIVEGEKTSFTCDFSDDNEMAIAWTFSRDPGRRVYIRQEDIGLSQPRTDTMTSDYELIMDEKSQTSTLVLTNPQPHVDAGLYECGVIVAGASETFSSYGSARLTILPISAFVSCSLSQLGEDKEVEMMCEWSDIEGGTAHFATGGDQPIAPDIQIPNRIVSRVTVKSLSDIKCFVSWSNNTKMDAAQCKINDAGIDELSQNGLVKIEPFISEVSVGSNATFHCIHGTEFDDPPPVTWMKVSSTPTPISNSQRFVVNDDMMTVVGVETLDEYVLFECRIVIRSVNGEFSSFAAVRIVKPSMSTLHPEHTSSQNIPNLMSIASDTSFDDAPSVVARLVKIVSVCLVLIVVAVFAILCSTFRLLFSRKGKQKTASSTATAIVDSTILAQWLGKPDIARPDQGDYQMSIFSGKQNSYQQQEDCIYETIPDVFAHFDSDEGGMSSLEWNTVESSPTKEKLGDLVGPTQSREGTLIKSCLVAPSKNAHTLEAQFQVLTGECDEHDMKACQFVVAEVYMDMSGAAPRTTYDYPHPGKSQSTSSPGADELDSPSSAPSLTDSLAPMTLC